MGGVVQKHSAGGVIISNGEVLLIHWDFPRNSYDFPKGSIEQGESAEEACIREVLEETGYETEVIEYIGDTHYEYDWIDGNHHQKKVEYYLLRIIGESEEGPAREEHETFENLWVPIEDAARILTRDNNKAIFEQALLQVNA